MIFLFNLLLSSAICAALSSEVNSRELYIDYTDLARVDVSTSHKGLAHAYGLAAGDYNGNSGMYVSAFKPPAVYFMDTSTGCESTDTCELVQLVGTGVAGITDGAFAGDGGTEASISDPSRMAYSADLNVVFVMDRTNGLIRYLDLASRTVGTVRSGGSPIQIYGSKLPDNNPELDIVISGAHLYVSDSSWIYNITGADGTLAGVLTDAVITPYHALKAWQIDNGYERSEKVYLTSLAVNENAGVIYVSYTYRRHAIVEVPIDVGSSNDISILTSDNVLWNPVQTVPQSVNGYVLDTPPSGYAYVTFPMHMHYDSETNGIYFVEVFAHFSSGTILGALGSVSVRRLLLDTLMVDYIAGFEGTFRPIYGRETGYVDGWAEVAEFSYPVTISFIGASVSGNGGLKAYVLDSQNCAIRKLEAITDTPYPTAAPTISMAPTTPTVAPTTGFPSFSPTNAPATAEPTVSPTSAPSISLSPTVYSPPTNVPTELNGECLNVVVSDSFGDGWGDAVLQISSPGHEDEYFVLSPSSSDPVSGTICSSYLRPEQFGLYNAYVVSSEDVTQPWEIQWTITIDSNGQTYAGGAETVLVFNFDDNGFVFVDSSDPTASFADDSSCRRCPHPKPKPKPKPTSGHSGSGSSSGANDDDADDDDYSDIMRQMMEFDSIAVTQEEYRQLLPHSKPPPAHPKPKVKTYELPFVLHDNGGNGWIDSSGSGSKYYIINDRRTDIAAEGTLCGEDLLKDDCAAQLPDGDYYFRVTGSGSRADEEVSWNFCGQRGYARQELSFSIIHGKCSAGVLRDANTILNQELKTKVTLSFSLLVENVFASALSYDDIDAIEEGVSQYLDAYNSSSFDAVVESKCQSRDAGRFCSEKGSKTKPKPVAKGTSTWEVNLYLYFLVEDVGVDGTKHRDVLRFADQVRHGLSDGIRKDDIQNSIRVAADGSDSLSWVHIRREKPAELVGVNYLFFGRLDAESLDQQPQMSEGFEGGVLEAEIVTVVVDDSDKQYVMILAVLGIPLLAVLAFLGYRRTVQTNDVVLGVRPSPVKKGGWETVVFEDADSSAHPSSASASPRAHDSETVIGRSSLPYPHSGFVNKGSSPANRKGDSRSSRSVESLLQIPGRAPSGSNSITSNPSAVDVPNSDKGRAESSSQVLNHEASPSIARQLPLATAGTSRLSQSGGLQRDRFRIREGLDHHDLSSARSSLTEDKIVL